MNTNDFGRDILVENCRKIDANELLVRAKVKLKEELVLKEAQVNGFNIKLTTSKTGFGGARVWFSCPLCSKRVGIIYQHPLNEQIGCRTCLGLKYRKRRYKGMVENDIL